MGDRHFRIRCIAKEQFALTAKSKILPKLKDVPNSREIRALANQLHAAGKHWQGEKFGWQSEYTPERRSKPAGSKMRFTPADFWIGESGIWFYSLMWAHGKKQAPVEFLDDRGIVKE